MFNDHYPSTTGNILPVKKLYYANTRGRPGYPFKIVFKRCKTKYWRTYNNFYLSGHRGLIGGKKPEPIPVLINMEASVSAWLRGKYNNYPFHSEYKDRFAETRTIFLEKYEDWKYLVENFGAFVISAERPINNTHWALLTSGEKLVFRKTKFWKKYRYKVGFLSKPEFYQTSLMWLKEFFEERSEDDYKFNHTLLRAIRDNDIRNASGLFSISNRYNMPKKRWYYYGHNIFINEKEDIVLLKLRMNDTIAMIEQCMTYDEVENFEKELKIEN